MNHRTIYRACIELLGHDSQKADIFAFTCIAFERAERAKRALMIAEDRLQTAKEEFAASYGVPHNGKRAN